MANQNDLPIWARILLGIPVSEAEASDGSESESQARERERRPECCRSSTKEQTVLVFNPLADNRNCCWQTMLRPIRREF